MYLVNMNLAWDSQHNCNFPFFFANACSNKILIHRGSKLSNKDFSDTTILVDMKLVYINTVILKSSICCIKIEKYIDHERQN